MVKVKMLELERGDDSFRMSIQESCILIEKTTKVPKRFVEAKYAKKYFYDVHKVGSMIQCKSQAVLMMVMAQQLRSLLIEKDGRFYLSSDGSLDERATLRLYIPDEEYPEAMSEVTITDGVALFIRTEISRMFVNNRKMKKQYKRLFWMTSMRGKHRMFLRQVVAMNAAVLRLMLDLLEGDFENGFYFNLSKLDPNTELI